MKFHPLKTIEVNTESLETEYKSAREIGKLRLGAERFYFRSARKIFYIPYTDIHRYFRRVMLVPAKLCCGKGNLAVEYFVVCDTDSELAQIQLPGSHAAKVLMEQMSELAPNALAGTPSKASDEEIQTEEDGKNDC